MRLCLVFLLWISGSADAFSTDKTPFSQAYEAVFELKMAEARDIIQKQPDAPRMVLAANYLDAVELMLNEDKALYKKRKDLEEKRLDLLKNDPAAQAVAGLQWGVVKLTFGDFWSSAWTIRRSYLQLQEAHLKKPEPLTKMYYGLMQAILGLIPEQYRSLAKIAGFEGGNLDKGLLLIKEVKNDPVFGLEAQLYEQMLLAFVQHQAKEAAQNMQHIYTQNQDNYLTALTLCVISTKARQSAVTLRTLQQARWQQADYLKVPVSQYMIAEALIYRGDYRLANQYYDRFLQSFKGDNYVKDSWYKKALCQWILGNEEQANDLLEKAADSGSDKTEADRYADHMTDQDHWPDVRLLKARLYYDGGFYDKAGRLLDSLEIQHFETTADKTELTYRKARLHQALGRSEMARKRYIECISLGSSLSDNYLPPNACLQIAKMYQSQGNITEARKYAKKVLVYKNYPYQNSISDKAKKVLKETE